MRRSHPSSIDPKGLAGISFDVCSIASTETASTVAGRGRGGGNARKRRGGGVAGSCPDDDDCMDRKGVNGLYSDPFSSMFSPTSALSSGMGGLMGRRVRSSSTNGHVGPSVGASSSSMGPPDARRSHHTLIGNKQNSHHRSAVTTSLQSVRVDMSPNGSPVSPIPPSVTSNIAPTINAFRRCLLMNKGNGQAVAPCTSSASLRHGNSDCASETSTSVYFYQADDEHSGGRASQNQPYPLVEVEVTETIMEIEEFSASPVEGDNVVSEETHIFLFDNDEDDACTEGNAMTAGRRPHSNEAGHCGGKERRSALSRRQQYGSTSHSASAPYAKAPLQSSGVCDFPTAGTSRKQRRACRSRYDIDEESDAEEEGGMGLRKKGGSAIYYVQVSHSALTPKDGPDDLRQVPQMPLLPSSVATAVIDEELAVLEELML